MKTLSILFVLLSGCFALAGQNVLLFPKQSVTDYVILKPSVEQALKQLTVCVRSYSDLQREHSLFSLATPGKDNAFLIYPVPPNKICISINNEDLYFNVDPDVLDWKQTCVAWDSATGLLQLWVNAKRYPRRVTTSRSPIGPQISVILGQDQDTFGGGFQASQCFVGEMSDVNMWDYILDTKTISNNYLYKSGNIFSWTNGAKEIKGGVIGLERYCNSL
ncbi:jeltraxin-like [Eleutherodactylus coqui]|uniref:jeltraxin-like n=1 Tax=Eleutherodactylus coqui TaxID=57060 RepID=UPI0034633DF1